MTPYITGRIDERLAEEGKRRKVALAIPQFLLIPELVVKTDLVATMGEGVAQRYATRLPLQVLPLPVALERVTIMQAWHPLKHADPAHEWAARPDRRGGEGRLVRGTRERWQSRCVPRHDPRARWSYT